MFIEADIFRYNGDLWRSIWPRGLPNYVDSIRWQNRNKVLFQQKVSKGWLIKYIFYLEMYPSQSWSSWDKEESVACQIVTFPFNNKLGGFFYKIKKIGFQKQPIASWSKELHCPVSKCHKGGSGALKM